MTSQLKPFATIRHNDAQGDDPRRVTLCTMDGCDYLWAMATTDDEDDYETDVKPEDAHLAWSGECWDLQFVDDAD